MARENLMTVDATAEMLSVSKKTVLALIAEGRLRAAKVGKRWLVKSEWVDSFLDDASKGERRL